MGRKGSEGKSSGKIRKEFSREKVKNKEKIKRQENKV